MPTTAMTNPFRLEEAISVLEATPGVLHALLQDLPDEWLRFQEDPQAWSPHTVLVHYLHNERANWMPRLRVILSDDDVRRFPPFQQLPEQPEPDGASAAALLDEFARLRGENLAYVRGLGLDPAAFSRQAEHPVLGTVTLGHLLATWVVHDLNHLHQIAKTLASRYQVAVGPWRQYLGILDV